MPGPVVRPQAHVIADSISPVGARVTTMEVTFHRFILPEFNTHRAFSRNAASSRALPIRKMISSVRDNPAIPLFWGANQPGMSARAALVTPALELAQSEWRNALESALATAERLAAADINLHKQTVNRILEPFAWVTMIVTATEWWNFFSNRLHADAQPEMQALAEVMYFAYCKSVPQRLALGDWHLPLIQPDELTIGTPFLRRASVARCARISYLTHDDRRDFQADLNLYDRLMSGGANGHWSPTEHVATPLEDPHAVSGNFHGWQQFRKTFPGENVYSEAAFDDMRGDLLQKHLH